MSVVYIVVSEDDITAGKAAPPLLVEFGPGRRTIKWRGRSFNVAAARVVGIA
jgi:hypothetical protein